MRPEHPPARTDAQGRSREHTIRAQQQAKPDTPCKIRDGDAAEHGVSFKGKPDFDVPQLLRARS